MLVVVFPAYVFIATLAIVTASKENDIRLAVVQDRENVDVIITQTDGKLQWCETPCSDWSQLAKPDGVDGLVSNPIAYKSADNKTHIFCRGTDGQVYALDQITISPVSFGSWYLVGSVGHKLPGLPTNGRDSLVVTANRHNQLTLFVRSGENATSFLYWSVSQGGEHGSWTTWNVVGGKDVHLKYDATVMLNNFVRRLEAFAVMTDGHLYHTWQSGDTSWHDWEKVWLLQPSFNSTPVVSQRGGRTTFNGQLEVFVRGHDGVLHHIWETTCDKVNNPWGPCTFGAYSKIGGDIPGGRESQNPLSVAKNIHDSNEVFVVDEKGQLWHIYQLEQGKSWGQWKVLHGPSNETTKFTSEATVKIDKFGWWQAYALDADKSVSIYQQSRSLVLSSKSVSSGGNVTVSWAVPEDEATNKDWIGVFVAGAVDEEYVDYEYVNGGQNSRHNAVPKGRVTLHSVLPDGQYDYRYLVNKKFLSAMSSSLTVYNETRDVEWEQVYHGLLIGLGIEAVNITKCVDDGNKTFETFRAALIAFEDREVIKGLQLLGDGLEDLLQALIQCEETDIVEALEKFIKDLIHCTEGNCVSFVIDVVDGILNVLYENVYEIYGDIRGAQNSFKIKAYVQEGICIGRVTAACIGQPRESTTLQLKLKDI